MGDLKVALLFNTVNITFRGKAYFFPACSKEQAIDIKSHLKMLEENELHEIIVGTLDKHFIPCDEV